MYDVNSAEYLEHKKYIETRKKEIQIEMNRFLESNLNELTISKKRYLDMWEDSEWKSDMLDLLEEALMKIASGESDPRSIAKRALNKYTGNE